MTQSNNNQHTSISKFGGMQNNSAVNANGGAGNAAEKKAALFDEDFEKDYQKYNSQQIKNQENAQLLRKSMDDAA
jgi:hypothetical protein